MTHFGDLEELFQKENRKAIDHPMIEQTWRFCTVFSAGSDRGIMTGRNWDNQNVGSIIVSYYKPKKGYASVSFSRAIDLGFPLNIRLDEMAKSPFRKKLLPALFYTYDGVNENGLCVAVSGIKTVKIEQKEGKESVFIGFLVRKLLDRTRSVEEAIQLAEKYIPFDLDKNSLSCHLLISDHSGRSVILEYHKNGWEKIFSKKKWQVMTNKVIFNTSEATLNKKCWRYKTADSFLKKKAGKISWREGMNLLKDVSQKGTTWSVIYTSYNELYFSVYQTWDKIYHLKFPERLGSTL